MSIRAILALALVTACSARDNDAPTSSAAGSASASAPLTASADEVAYAFGAWWDRAANSGDPLDIADLAQREGAAGLVHGLSDPKYADVARAALPSTGDAMLALQPLAAQLRSGSDEEAERSGETILAILGSTTGQFGERLDPEGELSAVADLQAVAAQPSAAARRGLAIGALTRLCSERRLCDPGTVPTE